MEPGTHILDNHDQEGQLDAQSLVLIGRTRDVVGGYVRAHDLEHAGLDVLVRDTLDVAIPHLLVPDLQWFAAYTVEDGQEA